MKRTKRSFTFLFLLLSLVSLAVLSIENRSAVAQTNTFGVTVTQMTNSPTDILVATAVFGVVLLLLLALLLSRIADP